MFLCWKRTFKYLFQKSLFLLQETNLGFEDQSTHRMAQTGACRHRCTYKKSYSFYGAVIRNDEYWSRDYRSHWKNIPIPQIFVEVKENGLENPEFKLALLMAFSLVLVRKLIVVWVQPVDQDTFRATESFRLETPSEVTQSKHPPSTAKATAKPCPQAPHPHGFF